MNQKINFVCPNLSTLERNIEREENEIRTNLGVNFLIESVLSTNSE